MSEKNTGGPAFPFAFGDDDRVSDGMTLRDYFAAKAMQALIRDPWYAEQKNTAMSDLAVGIAKDAYTTADFMLKARES